MALILALLEHSEQHAQVRASLEQAGHEVLVVDSFARAKKVLRVHSFDLIISDAHLENGGSVFDFLRWVKDDPASNQTPFVLFSMKPSPLAKYLADGVLTTARVFGAAKYIIMTPFDAAAFTQEIAEVLPPPGTAVPNYSYEGR